MLHEREDLFHDLFLSVYRVDQRFSVVDPERPLHRHRIGSINLQRQVQNALKLLHDIHHHLRFIDPRKSHVDVENIGAALLLGNTHGEDVCQVLIL